MFHPTVHMSAALEDKLFQTGQITELSNGSAASFLEKEDFAISSEFHGKFHARYTD